MTVYVSNRAQLLSALANASGGETLVLADGDYGTLQISDRDFGSKVTITSENANGARFETVEINNSSNININSVHVDNSSNGGASSHLVAIKNGSTNIDFTDNEVNGLVDNAYAGHYGIYVEGSSGVKIADNYVHDVKNGMVFVEAKNSTVSGNSINYIGEDSFKFIAVDGMLIENNTGASYVYPRADAHLDFMQFQGGNSSNVTLRGNVFLPGNAAAATAQGIFMDDAHYSNFLIEQNIIVTGMLRGISVSSGSNIVARYNTVLDVDGVGSKATLVIIDGGSAYGNIIGTYATDKSLGSDGNLKIQQTDPNGAWHYSDYFANADTGVGITLADLTPVAGSLAETMGAYARLAELLDGVVDDVDDVIAPGGGSGSDGSDGTDGSDGSDGTDGGDGSDGTDGGDGSDGTDGGDGSDGTDGGDGSDGTDGGDGSDGTDGGDGSDGTDGGDGSDGTDGGDGSDGTDGGDNDGTMAVVYSFAGTQTIASSSDVIEIAPTTDLALDAATVCFTFEADSVSGRQGLFSRDASGYTGDGNHISAYIEDGDLLIRFQHGSNDHYVTVEGISAGQSYDLQFAFDGAETSVWLDGELVGTAAFGTSWSNSPEYVQFGALGWASKTGTSGYTAVFGGTMSDMMIVEGAQSPDDMSGGGDVGGGEDGTGDTGAIYSYDGAHEIASSADVIEIAPTADLALDAGTIALTFEADSVSGRKGIFSRDASGYTGDGNHISAYIENGSLVVRFQDGSTDSYVTVDGIVVDQAYDLQLSFDGSETAVWLDGALVGTAEFGTNWSTSGEYLQFGALGWASTAGSSGYTAVFDGTISDMSIMEGAKAPGVLTSGSSELADSKVMTLTSVYSFEGSQDIASSSDVIEIAPTADLALDAATVSFSFEADSLSARQGLFSRDASGYTGDGNHISAYLEGDDLLVRFQDGSTDSYVTVEGINAGETYDLQLSFDGTETSVWLNGELVGTSEFSTDWSTSSEFVQFGALGWASKAGASGYTAVFDGTLSDMMIIDGAYEPEVTDDALFTALSSALADDFLFGETTTTETTDDVADADLAFFGGLFQSSIDTTDHTSDTYYL